MYNMPPINPIAFQIGSIAIHWYGLMYLISFILASFLLRYRIKKYPQYTSWTAIQIDDLLFYGMIGVVIGGRIGHVFIYQWAYYRENLDEILKIWQGGMSFHGGLIGVIIACWLFSKNTKRSFFSITDFIAPVVPVGLFFGRIGNFINGELWGRITEQDWGVVFPQARDQLPRHPSQIYEAFGEGLIIFILLWVYLRKPRIAGTASAMFLFFYGSIRFFIEYYKEPEEFLGFQALDLTMGQLLCIPMIIIGIWLLFLGEFKDLWHKKLPELPFKEKIKNKINKTTKK